MPSSTVMLGDAPNGAKGTNTIYLDTIEAYDQWAEVYDTDGNFLQALDTLEMQSLLPIFLSLATNDGIRSLDACKFIDLGCGTGRNTLALQRAAPQATIIGLEPSSKMLDKAKKRLEAQIAEQGQQEGKVSIQSYNLLDDSSASTGSLEYADGIISTLVLEHVPAPRFFSAVANMLRPGGILLVTNMHPDMGAISQAGFVHPVTKDKIRPTSYAHTVEETIEAAAAAGLELVGEIKEQGVDEKLAGMLGRRAKKWIGVKVWYGGCFRKK
ncbi:hypothetical protein VTO42DRAFT_2817 [Malbranchea cinnamomea]